MWLQDPLTQLMLSRLKQDSDSHTTEAKKIAGAEPEKNKELLFNHLQKSLTIDNIIQEIKNGSGKYWQY